MERDIRNLFKVDEHSNIELPNNHREDFIAKLQIQNKKKQAFKKSSLLKIAIAIVLIFSASIYVFVGNQSSLENKEESTFQAQIKAIEKEYLENINSEWQQFLAISNDSILIKKYRVKLKNFDNEYRKITNQLQKTPNNINILESLINNLQRRLELVKNIKEHIKELNQKNTSNETIYL
ncbi:hypothetical protein [Polaribacter sp. R77954]|uniref:hypothetical protein n=1 Tax=Polaribacter sp. R77954 TaxID=3093870 RepID=UPI0037C6904C